jgi:hypothetical protein
VVEEVVVMVVGITMQQAQHNMVKTELIVQAVVVAERRVALENRAAQAAQA